MYVRECRYGTISALRPMIPATLAVIIATAAAFILHAAGAGEATNTAASIAAGGGFWLGFLTGTTVTVRRSR